MAVSEFIDIQDIHNVFVAGVQRSGNVSRDEIIPLNRIDLDLEQFKPEALQRFISAVREITEGSRIERPVSKPDPIAAIFMNINADEVISEDDYQKFEKLRLADKWRGNRIGQINELIIDLFQNFRLSTSGKLDVVVYKSNDTNDPIAIAEIKNRYNTMNAASAIRTRQTMESLVLDKGSSFFGCDAVLVERIPKTDGSEALFNPSDPKRGQVGNPSEKIKRMGLQQFLTRYCKDETAYVKAIILIAKTLVATGALPDDYDLRFIFSLLHQSLT